VSFQRTRVKIQHISYRTSSARTATFAGTWKRACFSYNREIGRDISMSKIEYKTLNDRAYDEIKKGLMAGKISPGQPVVIRTLAENYGISATPVREALQRLVAERLLEMLPNRSIAVPELSAEKFVELVRIRTALEGLAAELATPNFKLAHIQKLS